MEKKLDLRVQKTRAALTSSLYSLLCEKGLNEITVTELCDRAMVRKATFYKHFADKSELLAYMIQDLQRVAYEQNTLGYDESVPMSFYTGVFRYFMDFLEGNERLVTSILKSSASSGVLDIVSEQIRRDISRHMKTESDATIAQSSAMLAAMYTGAIVSCGRWWIMQKNRPDKEQVVKTFDELVAKL